MRVVNVRIQRTRCLLCAFELFRSDGHNGGRKNSRRRELHYVVGMSNLSKSSIPIAAVALTAAVTVVALTAGRNNNTIDEDDGKKKSSRKKVSISSFFSSSSRRSFFSSSSSSSSSNDTYWLRNVRVPIGNLRRCNQKKNATKDVTIRDDEEGLVDVHIKISSGAIDEIVEREPTLLLKRDSTSTTFDDSDNVRNIEGYDSIVVPCFVDVHTHLMKTQTIQRNRNYTNTMNEAIQVEICDQPRWGENNGSGILRQMEFAIQCSLHHGTKAIRTHLDGSENYNAPNVQQAVWDAYDFLVDKYEDVMTIQGVANLFLPLWLPSVEEGKEDFGTKYANDASKHKNTVLGAYVGNPQTEDEAVQALDSLFEHAIRLNMDVDLHIDESNDVKCCGLQSLCISLHKARTMKNYSGRVVLGHCCSLSLQTKKKQDAIITVLSNLGNVYVVANPFTNLSLQDRNGTKPPYGTDIPKDIPRTPKWRGITIVQELRATTTTKTSAGSNGLGIGVALASDNVRDHWYRYGDYDMLAVWFMGQALGHLDTCTNEGEWSDICTTTPAEAMGLISPDDDETAENDENGAEDEMDDSRLVLTAGKFAPADLVVFPSARTFSELFARPSQEDRIVLRNGIPHTFPLPDFCELDDLVSTKTPRPNFDGNDEIPDGFMH